MAAAVGGSLMPVTSGLPNLVYPSEGNLAKFTGNYLARELRNICNDTKGLFPKSAKRDENYYAKNGQPWRYMSNYESDFNGRYWHEEKYKTRAKVVVEKERWPVIGQHPADDRNERKKMKLKMFMNWKIPERVVSNDGPSRASTRGSAASKPSAQSDQLPKIPDLMHSTPMPTSPKILTPTKSATPRLPTKPSVRGPAQEAIRHSLDPKLQRKAEELLESAAPCERRAIEKAVLAAQRAGRQGAGQPRRTYKADAKTAVNRWLDDATDEERALALKFFQTVSTSKMMGESADKQKRLNQVVSHLETGQAHGVSYSHPGHPMKSDRTGLKTIQLYPSEERRNRWQHTTWHHMPDYRDTDRVDNRSAIYIDSQKSIPRHYTIHPDWGM